MNTNVLYIMLLDASVKFLIPLILPPKKKLGRPIENWCLGKILLSTPLKPLKPLIYTPTLQKKEAGTS